MLDGDNLDYRLRERLTVLAADKMDTLQDALSAKIISRLAKSLDQG